MKTLQTRLALLSGAFALSLGVASNAAAQGAQHAQHGTAAASGSQHEGMAGHEMMQVMKDMNQKMSGMQMIGDHDHDFAMMMRSHHQAGIDMAKAELKNGKDPQMQQTAKKIISDQTKEIEKLDQWMAKHKVSAK